MEWLRNGCVVPVVCLLVAAACGVPDAEPGSTEEPSARVVDEAPDGGPVQSGEREPVSGFALDAPVGPGGGSLPVEPSEKRPPPPPVHLPDSGSRPHFQRPAAIRGVYLNAWASGSTRRLNEFVELARSTEVNAFVMDIKDATGYVSYASGVPAVREVGALDEIRIRDIAGTLRRLEAEGIYPIARIVIVKDPLLVSARPHLAVQDTAGGVWVDSKELVWLNLYNREVWEYHVALAEEAARLGFPEIQWDYVRFPDASEEDMARAVFPGDTLGPRSEAVRAFLGHARERLDALGYDVSMTADVFGVTTTFSRDVGIGQLWERFIDRVDAALPMVYPSHYWQGSFDIEDPNAHPYEVVREAMEDATRRSARVEGAGRVIPWLQDFTLGPPRYEAPEVRAQIQAVYDAGLEEWVLWNPGSRYTVEALQPRMGFHLEPLVRVGGEIVATSDRFTALERAARSRFVADSLLQVAADSLQRIEADTASLGGSGNGGE
jgi:hypothetical protein